MLSTSIIAYRSRAQTSWIPSRDFEQSVKGRLADERWQLFGKG